MLCQVKEASHEKSYIKCFYFFEMSRIVTPCTDGLHIPGFAVCEFNQPQIKNIQEKGVFAMNMYSFFPYHHSLQNIYVAFTFYWVLNII
jgi:hypothetical protein